METAPARATTADLDRLAEVVAAATGEAVGSGRALRDVERRLLPGRVDNMTTAALERVTGSLPSGTRWSVVAKVLRPASASPLFAFVPEEHQAPVLAALHWLDEPRVYRSGVGRGLPDGLRMPRLFGVDEEHDRITLWLEDVADVAPWGLDRYRRTARLLGRMSARWPAARARDELGLAGRDLGTMFFGKVLHADLPAQADDGFWVDPAVAAAVDDRHRADLARLAMAVPALLSRVDDLPSGLCHGDASPANFLEPGDGTVVAVDWSYGHVGAIGSDLGQLLAGRFESGAARPADVGAIAPVLLEAYQQGLADEGADVPAEVLELAWATHLAVRSVFSALLVDGPEALLPRTALGRFGLDLALRCAATTGRGNGTIV